MHVSLISKSDHRVTGLRRYSDTLSRELADLNIEIERAFPTTPLPSRMTQAVRRGGWDLDTFFQTYPIRGQFEAAHVYHLTSETLATLLLFSRLKPSIVTVHAFFSYLLRDAPDVAMRSHPVQRWFDILAARGLRRANRVIAVSEYVKATMVEQLGIPSERIDVVPEAVDHSFFFPRPVPMSFRDKHGLSPDWRYVLYVGSEQPRKNFLTLLRAFARVRQQCPNVRLIKVGQPELQHERVRAMSLIAELGIGDAVIFHGHVGEELPLFYSVSDVFVFPSLYEGFGFPPLEAMACGTPVICSNTTSLPEVVGDAALTFDPTDEERLVELIVRFIHDDALQREYRQRGIEQAGRFDWAVTASRTIDIYRQVISQTSGVQDVIRGEVVR